MKRRDLIRHLRTFGFEGPFQGPDHLFMLRGHLRLRVPNTHEGDPSADLVLKILKQASITREEWEKR